MSAESNKNFECNVCSLKFENSNELLEHKLSFLHHVKLEKTSGQCKHECDLCLDKFDSLADFSKHLESDSHKGQISVYEYQKQAIKNFRPPPLLSLPTGMNNSYPYRGAFPPNQFSGPSTKFNVAPPMPNQFPGSNFNAGPPPSNYGYGPSGFNSWPPNPNNYQDNFYDFNHPGGAPKNYYDFGGTPNQWTAGPSSSSTSLQNPWSAGPSSNSTKFIKNTTFRGSGPSTSKNPKHWKQYKHPCGIRYNQSNKGSNNRVIIPDTNSYFEPEVPLNVKNMPDLDFRKTMLTNKNMHASKGLEKKLENQLKQQKKSEKKKQKKSKQHDKGASSSKDPGRWHEKNERKKKNKKFKKMNNGIQLISYATTQEDINKYVEPDSTTLLAVCDPIVVAVQLDLAEKPCDTASSNGVQGDSAEKPKSKVASGTLPPKPMNFADSMKKAFRCPATSSADVSKRLLAGRINRYRLEAATVSTSQSSSSALSRSISESDSEKMPVDNIAVNPCRIASKDSAKVPLIKKELLLSTSKVPNIPSLKIDSVSKQPSSLPIDSISKQKLSEIVESVVNQSSLRITEHGCNAENLKRKIASDSCRTTYLSKKGIVKNISNAILDEPAKLVDISSANCKVATNIVPLSTTVVSTGKLAGNTLTDKSINSSDTSVNCKAVTNPVSFTETIPPTETVAGTCLNSTNLKTKSTPYLIADPSKEKFMLPNEEMLDEYFNAIQYVAKCEEETLQLDKNRQSELNVTAVKSSANDSVNAHSSKTVMEPHPVTTVDATPSEDLSSIFGQDSSQMSKMQLLWQVCQREDRYQTEYLAACNELAELEHKLELCKKRKSDAEIRYSKNKELRRHLLQSDKNDFGSLLADISGQSLLEPHVIAELEPHHPAYNLTYLGMVSAEQSVVQNLESVLGVSLNVPKTASLVSGGREKAPEHLNHPSISSCGLANVKHEM